MDVTGHCAFVLVTSTTKLSDLLKCYCFKKCFPPLVTKIKAEPIIEPIILENVINI